MQTLNGKSILFIGSTFFGYAQRIITHLRERGATVDFQTDCPDNMYYKFLSICAPQRADNILIKFYDDLVPTLQGKYDYVLIIKGNQIPISFYTALRKLNKSAKFILYNWDDLDLYPAIKERFSFFDKIYSFNILDCQKYNLNLRPMFFEHRTDENYAKRSNDVFFIGSWHSDRDRILKSFEINNPRLHFQSHLYINPLTFLYNPGLYSCYRMYHFSKMNYNTMIGTIAASKAILDIPFINQTGLTTRAFEAMGCNTKIITTNENIRLYDFYNPTNILIIDRKNPTVGMDWLEMPLQKIPEPILNKYSINAWIDDIFTD